MASVSLSSPPTTFSPLPSSGPPRHARKHSRQPTAAAPLPSFSFNPGAESQQKQDEEETETENRNPAGSGLMRRPSKSAPLPQFKFNPGADIPIARTPSPTHPVLEEMALNQQRVSKSAKPAPLPVFTFNPGAAAPGSISPTKLDSEAEQGRFTGHKRAGSEFVGGATDGAQLVVASPVKHEAKPGGPPVSSANPRGHMHRRSQAISVSDIDTSELIKQHAIAKARAPSNPATPNQSTFSIPRASPGQRTSTQPSTRSPPGSPRRTGSSHGFRPCIVDFSDTVDIIPRPRPLSMISSETERSNSSFRGHSVTNSISSIVSPPQQTQSDSSVPTLKNENLLNRRPNTADASLLLTSVTSTNSHDLLAIPKRPLSACGSPMVSTSGSPPAKKKHFWSAYGSGSSPTPTPRQEKTDLLQEVPTVAPIVESNRIRPKTAPERPSAHKKRKYHTWTAGIFSKRSKHRASKAKSRRSPTPPALLRKDSERVADIFDTDNTVVLREESPVGARKQPFQEPHLSIPQPAFTANEISRQVIDLDMAMQSLDESARNSDDHVRRTTAKIAKLHSSERRGVVDAFGINHRRTESAPALSPVNRSALFGLPRHGSNASLNEDVFDEEEEDNFLAHEQHIRSLGTRLTKTSSRKEPAQGENGLGLTNVPSHTDDVVIVDLEIGADIADLRSSKSTIEAPVSVADEMPKRPATSPIPFAYPEPQLHYASSTEGRNTSASLISSPDADYVSIDIHGRPRRFEHNPDSVRPSTDDLPSLSDSVSSNAFPRGSCSGNVRPSLEQRSNSMFVPGSTRLHENWKRSSLASLNRLIPGSSHGSKLKLETNAPEGEEKSKKKSNRISKLMRFWRSKETGEDKSSIS